MASCPALDAWHGARGWVLEHPPGAVSEGWISRQDYEEKGGEYLSEHCASNAFVPMKIAKPARPAEPPVTMQASTEGPAAITMVTSDPTPSSSSTSAVADVTMVTTWSKALWYPPRRVRSSGMISGWSEGLHFVLFRSTRLGSSFFNNRQKAAVTPAERFGLWIPGAGKKPLKWAWERREMHNCKWIRSIVHCCSWWNHKSSYWTGIKWMLLKAKSIFLYYCVSIILFCMSVFLKNKTKTFPLLETVVCLLIVKEIWYFVSSVPSSSLLSFPVF